MRWKPTAANERLFKIRLLRGHSETKLYKKWRWIKVKLMFSKGLPRSFLDTTKKERLRLLRNYSAISLAPSTRSKLFLIEYFYFGSFATNQQKKGDNMPIFLTMIIIRAGYPTLFFAPRAGRSTPACYPAPKHDSVIDVIATSYHYWLHV